jgi:hypothetical protein
MNASRRSITLAALATVLSVHAVPGFAQTNTVTPVTFTDALHSSTTAAREYVAARSAAYDGVGLAPNLIVTSLYETVVASMLERSPTFRRQSARIAQASELTIEVRSEPRGAKSTLAWTTILRHAESRELRAIVHIVPGTSAVELIAHEIEHVIEQLDGVNLRHKASLRATGVRVCACGDGEMFETRRAIAVGRQVFREVQETSGRGE